MMPYHTKETGREKTDPKTRQKKIPIIPFLRDAHLLVLQEHMDPAEWLTI